ncbi:MAG: penicillin-binding protein 1A [Leadbetterella sp.]
MDSPATKYLAKGKYQIIISKIYGLFFWCLASIAIFIIALNLNLFWLFGKMPSIKDLDNPKSEIASEIVSSDGKSLGKFFFENRSPVRFEELPQNLINALLATEDVRFIKHSGIDARSMIRVFTGLLTLNPKGGGSTLSQQLAKNLFKLRYDEAYEGFLYKVPVIRTGIIKSKEWLTSIKIERIYTKTEIMTMYLNTIEFSSGAYGIKSAARTYFKKLPKDLNQEESALLVGMVQNPSLFNPKFHPEGSKKRRNVVFGQMVKANMINMEESAILSEKPIKLNYNPESHNQGSAQYFRQYIKEVMKKELNSLGIDEKTIYTKGYKIYTTIDSRMQQYAEEAVAEHMKYQQVTFNNHWKGRNPWVQRKNPTSREYIEIPGFIEKITERTDIYKQLKEKYDGDKKQIWKALDERVPMRVFSHKGEIDTVMSHLDSIKYYKKFLNIGMLAMDPLNGNIKAWVGGINFKYFKFDNVYQSRRQPGSTFKPFVYVTAIDNGFSTCERVTDAPVSFGKEDGVYGAIYTPKNSTGRYSYRSLTLRSALGQSINSVSARLIKDFKPSTVIDYAKKMGIKSELPNSPSLCLGVGEVTLLELLSGYAAFANEGKYTVPLVITRIEDKNGQVLKDFLPDQKEVLSKETAYKMVHLMRGATSPGGTAMGLSRFGVLDDNEVAAKTGTTSNYSDGWFMGMTHNLIAGVWVGGDDRAIHYRSIDLGQGAKVAMPAWGLFFKKVYADKEIEYKKGKFKIPEGVRISGDCVLSSTEDYPTSTTGGGGGSVPTTGPAEKPEDEDEQL